MNFQDFTLHLSKYWMDLGCLWGQPYDSMMGAGTFHPHTFLRGIGPEPWRAVYVQPCRRPVDGRYGKSSYRFQHYYQLQVLLKPSPSNIVDLFLQSLAHVGISLAENDVSLLEDDWKGPTLGAWGLGWEVRANGQEVTQFTYFQQLGGMDIDVVPGEITYGLERLYMYATGIKHGMEIPYNDNFSYADVFLQSEFEFSHFNFKEANTQELFAEFEQCEQNVCSLVEKLLVLPAYDFVLRASHAFNMLDARGAISATERQRYIGRVRDCAKKCAELYRMEREKLGFPLQKALSSDPREALYSVGGRSTSPASFGAGSEEEIQRIYVSSLDSAVNGETKVSTEPKETRVAKGGESQKASMVFEVGVEEMPPSFQESALQALTAQWTLFLEKKQQEFSFSTQFVEDLSKIITNFYVTSRRLAVELQNLPRQEPNNTLEIWGPAERIARGKSGELLPAGQGFLRKIGIDPSAAVFKERSDGTFLFASKSVFGQDFLNVVSLWFKNSVEGLEAPLMMKWLPAEISKPFVRPVRWILALVDNELFDFEMFGLKSGTCTVGPRFSGSQKLPIMRASEYRGTLQAVSVQLDWSARREGIAAQAHELAFSVNGRIRQDDSLLAKCTGLSETPYVFLGSFDRLYLSLPGVLISSVLREHMNYFSVEDEAGNLLPFYVGVAGFKCADLANMIAGTGNVVTGRLDDGDFYYKGDLETPLAEFNARLKNQLFQNEMGTLYDKGQRVAMLAYALAQKAMAEKDSSAKLADLAKVAGEFCKADLRTGCVQEFPDEMQGVMGGILVSYQRPFADDSEEIARAISGHYAPSSAASPLPPTLLGKLVSLADKLDSLCLMIAKGGEVKGNKDPFGLRRLAIGVLRLLGMDGHGSPFNVSLYKIAEMSCEVLRNAGFEVTESVTQKVVAFLLGRLKAAWKSEFDSGAVEATLVKISEYNISTLYVLASCANAALAQEGEGSLRQSLTPFWRSRNITQVEIEKGCLKGISLESLSVDEGLLRLQSEIDLFRKVVASHKEADVLIADRNFAGFFSLLAALGQPLAAFFETVMVLDDDLKVKHNRLALLYQLRGLYEKVADFSLVQVNG